MQSSTGQCTSHRGDPAQLVQFSFITARSAVPFLFLASAIDLHPSSLPCTGNRRTTPKSTTGIPNSNVSARSWPIRANRRSSATCDRAGPVRPGLRHSRAAPCAPARGRKAPPHPRAGGSGSCQSRPWPPASCPAPHTPSHGCWPPGRSPGSTPAPARSSPTACSRSPFRLSATPRLL